MLYHKEFSRFGDYSKIFIINKYASKWSLPLDIRTGCRSASRAPRRRAACRRSRTAARAGRAGRARRARAPGSSGTASSPCCPRDPRIAARFPAAAADAVGSVNNRKSGLQKPI